MSDFVAPQQAKWCPTCEAYSTQIRTPNRGERHCMVCGEVFGLASEPEKGNNMLDSYAESRGTWDVRPPKTATADIRSDVISVAIAEFQRDWLSGPFKNYR